MTTSEAMAYLDVKGVPMSRPTFMKRVEELGLSKQDGDGCNHRISRAKLENYVNELLGE